MLCTEYHCIDTFTPSSRKQILPNQHHSSPSNFKKMKHKHGRTDNVMFDHIVHTEWQLPLSCIHSITMEKSAQPGDGGGARPLPFTISTITYKVVVYASEGTYTPPISTLPLYRLCDFDHGERLYLYTMSLCTD